MKYNMHEVPEVRPAIKKKSKERKTFSISRDIWDFIFMHVPEGQRSRFVEEAIKQRIRREGWI